MYRKLIFFIVVLLLVCAGSAMADPNLVGHWKFDGNANDSSGNGNNGTLYGDHSSYVSGMIAQALNLDPNNDDEDDPNNAYVVVPDDNSLDFGKGSFSITLWIKYDITDNRGLLVTKGNSDGFWGWGDGGPGYRLQYSGHTFYMYISDGTTQRVMAGNGYAVDDGEWHQVEALCHRPAVGMNSMGIYVDSGPIGMGAIEAIGDINSPNDLYIGCNGVNGGEYADAAIDDVRIYDYVINVGEAFEIFAHDPSPEDGEEYVAVDAKLMWNPGMSSERFDVYFGTDESNVNDANTTTTLGVYKSNQDANSFDPNDPTASDLLPDKTYYWRIDSLDGSNNLLNKGDVWTFDSMLTKAHNPDPASNRDNVLLEVQLSWTAGYGSSSHDVYFGTDFDDVNDGTGGTSQGNQAGTTFDPNDPAGGDLRINTTYYWRIDEINGGSTITGDVWNFSTIESIDPNMMIHLTFDEGQGIYASDQSGHGNTGTLHSGATWIESALGGAIDFDGVEGRVEVQDDESISFGTKSFSIAFWVKSDNRSGRLLMNGSSGDPGSGNRYEIDFSGGGYGRMGFILDNDDEGKDGIGSIGYFTTGEWVHAVCVRDVENVKLRIYRNAILDRSVTPNHNGQDTNSPGENLFIACDEGPSSFMEGSLDDFRIYDYVLSEDDIKVLASKAAFPPAWDPKPVDGAPNVRQNTKIEWNKGVWAQYHDVYFGTDYNDVTDANNLNDVYRGQVFTESWDPSTDPCYASGLDWSTQYFWRIDEVNVPTSNYNKGDVWSFTTAGYIVVDDAELYDSDNEPNKVWEDGDSKAEFGVNCNGSKISLLTAGGRSGRALIYDYNNTGYGPAAEVSATPTFAYSEIAAGTNGSDSLDCGVDWTRDDVKALTLYFKGDPDNDVIGDANQMYLVIEDDSDANAMVKYGDLSGSPYEEDVNDLLLDSWMRWDIALSRFSGVDLNSVEKVYIGFGERGAAVPTKYGGSAQAGGNGTVQFDDLGLYKSRCVPQYAASSDLSDDCVIGYEDIDILQADWLDVNTVAVNPGTSNLVAHYKFEDNLDDSVGGVPDQNGIAYGNPTYVTGKIDSKAISFDGNDCVVVEDVNATIGAEFSTGPFSIALWIKSSNESAKERILCNGTEGNGKKWDLQNANDLQTGKRYELYFENNNTINFAIDDGGSEKSQVTTWNTNYATGDWVHVAAVRDTSENQIILYCDGVRNTGFVGGWDGEDVSGDISSPNEPLVFGAQPVDVNEGVYSFEDFMTGELDDVQIYDKALTVGEVIWIASEGGPTPDSMKVDTDLSLDNFVNLKDYAVLADAWLDEQFWP